MKKNFKELIGQSNISIEDALQQALNQINASARFKVIEMTASIKKNQDALYRATIEALDA